MTEPIADKLARKLVNRRNALTKEAEDKIVKAYLEPGASMRSVAEKTGHAVGTVLRAIHRAKNAKKAKAST